MTHADRDGSESPASDATRPPDATETPDGTRAGVETAEGRTEAQSDVCGNVCHGIGDGVMFCTRPADHDGGHTDGTAWWTLRESDAGGMDNQGAELDRLRARVATLQRITLDLADIAEAAERALADERATVARVVTVCQNTDGDWLDGSAEIPVGEVVRMLFPDGRPAPVDAAE